MYVLSWIFLGAAIGTLAYGLTQPGLTFIYVSIGASVVAMLFLLGGVLRKRPVQPATAGAPYGPTPEEAAARSADTAAVATMPAERRGAPSRPATPQRKPAAARTRTPARPPAAEEEAEAPSPGKRTTARKKPTKTAAAKPSAKKAPAAKKSTARTTARVVAIPERGTYHESGCRFVKGRTDTERLAKATAKRRGYSACGVCKPG